MALQSLDFGTIFRLQMILASTSLH